MLKIVGFCLFCWSLNGWTAESSQVRIGFFPNITHGQALYAKATGEFDKHTGAHFIWTSFNAGPTAIESIFTDAIDMTFVGPSPTVNGYVKSRGEKFVILAGAASGGTGLVIRKGSGIKSDKDFNDKIIATPQLGNTQDVAARLWFMEKHYKFKERGGSLTVLPLSNPDQLLMFRKRQIDGAWTVEPWVSRLEIEGNGQLFLDEKTLWPEGKYVTTHLIVSRAFLQKNPQLIKKLLAAYVDLTQKINADKMTAAKVMNEQLKKETGKPLKDEIINKALSRVEFTWDPVSSSFFKGANASLQIGFIKTPPKLDGIYALGPLNEVLKEKHLPEVAAAANSGTSSK